MNECKIKRKSEKNSWFEQLLFITNKLFSIFNGTFISIQWSESKKALERDSIAATNFIIITINVVIIVLVWRMDNFLLDFFVSFALFHTLLLASSCFVLFLPCTIIPILNSFFDSKSCYCH